MQITIHVSEEDRQRLIEIMAKAHLGSYHDVLSEALSVFSWCVDQTHDGMVVGAISGDNSFYRELFCPVFQKIKKSL